MAQEETKIDMGIEMTRLWYKDGYGHRASVVKYHDPMGTSNPLGETPTPKEDAPIYVALQDRQPELLINALQELEQYRARAASETKQRLDAADRLLEQMQELYEKSLDEYKAMTIERRISKPKKHWWSK